jgi:hypothetical protein
MLNFGPVEYRILALKLGESGVGHAARRMLHRPITAHMLRSSLAGMYKKESEMRHIRSALQGAISVFSLGIFAEPLHAQTMLATWYACPFSPACVAHRYYPKGTARGVVLDFGPAAWTGRALDVSSQLAEQLGMKRDGIANLQVTVISRSMKRR